jgi:hypothetical protein
MQLGYTGRRKKLPCASHWKTWVITSYSWAFWSALHTQGSKTDQFFPVLFLIHSRYLLLPPVMGREITSGTLHVRGTSKQEQCCTLYFTSLFVLGSTSTRSVNRMELTHIHGWLWHAQSRHLEVIPSSLWWAILPHQIAPERGQIITLVWKAGRDFQVET